MKIFARPQNGTGVNPGWLTFQLSLSFDYSSLNSANFSLLTEVTLIYDVHTYIIYICNMHIGLIMSSFPTYPIPITSCREWKGAIMRAQDRSKWTKEMELASKVVEEYLDALALFSGLAYQFEYWLFPYISFTLFNISNFTDHFLI